MTKPRLLYWDIETSLELAAIFDLKHNDWIDPSSLVTERYIICASWQWEGEKSVHSVSVLDSPKEYGKDPYNDAYVVQTLHKILSEADVIIGHNSDSFDKPYLDTRILYHGLSPLPPIISIDTYKIAKHKFRFNSNRLNYLGKYLGLGGKKETKSGLWMDVLKGDKNAIEQMVVYNKRDVSLLRDVFHKLQPYCASHINRQLFGQKEGCPRCGSKHVQSRGTHRAISRTYQRWQCQACGGWYRTMKPIVERTSTRVL